MVRVVVGTGAVVDGDGVVTTITEDELSGGEGKGSSVVGEGSRMGV